MSQRFLPLWIISLLGLCFPKTVPAATLPTLPTASEIRTGVLPNGVTYYIVTNKTFTGMVDVALVQKAGLGDEEEATRGETVVQSRASLTELPHFRVRSPFSYLRSKSLWPSERGFVQVSDDATVFRFDRLVLSRGREIVDSTLLMVFDIIGREDGSLKALYAPQNQAVIVSGDIDPDAVLGKMNMLSLLVPVTAGRTVERDYSWRDRMESEARRRPLSEGQIPGLHFVYRYPRTARSRMATAIPLVSSRYASELKVIIIRRLSRAFRAAGIPYAAIHFDYKGSASVPGDEIFEVQVDTAPQHFEAATRIVAATFSDLDRYGVTVDEYRDVTNQMTTELARRYGQEVVSNAHYVNRCIAAFLYGADLASAQTQMDFFSRRVIEDRTAVSLFNNFVAALLDRSRNFTLTTAGGSADPGHLLTVFRQSWDGAAHMAPVVCRTDSTALPRTGAKVKIKTEAPEPMSGGVMWTFSNGIRVIYRPTKDKTGLIHYDWLLKGGFSQMQGLRPGEGAYMTDMFRQNSFSGLSYERFYDMLLANGILFSPRVTLSDFRLTGISPAGRLPLLMKALQSVATERKMSAADYDYYRQCEQLRMKEIRPVRPALDSLLQADLTYTDVRRAIRLEDDFPKLADRYFAAQLDKMNDGVLVLSGNLDEAALKKLLCRQLGAFRTEKVTASRSRVRRSTVSQRRTRYVSGRRPMIAMAFSSPVTYTSESFMAAHVAASAMRDEIAAAVAQDGWHAAASWRVTQFPEEALSLEVILSQAAASGLPASMAGTDAVEEVLDKARRAVTALGAKGIGQSALVTGKTLISNSYSIWKTNPEIVAYLLFLRYCYGKDLMTDYAARIAAVTPAKVNPILSGLTGGGMAEFVVRALPVPLVEPRLSEPARPHVPPMVPYPGNFAYPMEGRTVPVDSLSLSDLRDLPVREFPQDSLWRAVRDSMFRSWGRPVPGDTLAIPLTEAPADSAAVAPLPAADSTAANPAR